MSNKISTEFVEDPILPEGYVEGEDIFADAPNDETDLPTIADDDEPAGEVTEDDDEATDEPPTTAVEPEGVPEPRKIKVRYNHEEMELDEDEAIAHIQKGMNYDRKVSALESRLAKAEQLAKRMGYETSAEMLDAAEKNMFEQKVAAYVDEGLHEAIARDLVEREWEKTAPEVKAQVDPVKEEIDSFIRNNPTVTSLPDEVVQAVVKQGVPLQMAYERYKSKKAQDEIKILRQNQAAAARAPVGSATKHGSTEQKATDPFIVGFDSDPW